MSCKCKKKQTLFIKIIDAIFSIAWGLSWAASLYFAFKSAKSDRFDVATWFLVWMLYFQHSKAPSLKALLGKISKNEQVL